MLRRPPSTKRSEALSYVQSMLAELRAMAEAEQCDMLAYLIEMAYIEAGDIVRGDRPAQMQRPGSRIASDKGNGAT